jgi:polyisoprenoid-binding protein YceI
MTTIGTATPVSTWTIDPVHSSVEFSIGYLSLALFRSRFHTFAGTLSINEADPAASAVTATIDVTSVETTSKDLYERLMDEDFFAASRFPTMTFRSTRVDAVGDAHWRVVGELTIRDVTREVVLDTQYLGQVVHPFTGGLIAAFTAETAINRKEFGLAFHGLLDSGAAMLGERVHIRLHIIPTRVA